MLKTRSQSALHRAPDPTQDFTADEQRRARALHLSVDVYRLQERLRKLPLVPREDWLRKKRTEIVKRLFATARRDRCLKHINPWAASDSRLPAVCDSK